MDVDSALVDRVLSREELRFQYVDEQGWDESCGYAALATLLGRYRGSAVNESDLLALSAPPGEKVKVSLAELVRLARQLGFEARPWRTSFDDLALLEAVPLLVHYDRPRGHFALVLSIGPAGVVTADPARGLELLTRSQFEARWSGVAVEVLKPGEPDSGRRVVEKAVKSALGRGAAIERALSNAPPKR